MTRVDSTKVVTTAYFGAQARLKNIILSERM